jgi:class 3 adenylate cyclase
LNLGSARPGEAIQTAAVEALTVLDLVRGYWNVLSVRFTHHGVVVVGGVGDTPRDLVQRYHHQMNLDRRQFATFVPEESTQDDYVARLTAVDEHVDRMLAPYRTEPHKGRHIKGDPA